MKLRFNPLLVFACSKTPAGLYARRKWLGESGSEQWKGDFQACVSHLLADQKRNGSWQQSEIETIRRLFGLHLTLRETSIEIEAALKWLFRFIDSRFSENRRAPQADSVVELPEDLPFVSGRRDMFLLGATLFLACIFGFDSDPFVLENYRRLSLAGIDSKGIWFDKASSNNVFRALVVHPVYSTDPATLLFVDSLSDMQTESGDWGADLPFYQILNALAHLDTPSADKQLEKAFARVIDSQNGDGTWADTACEWNTFLTVHALKNKGLI